MQDRDDWYGYIYPKNLEVMSRPKILVPSIGVQAEFCLDIRGDFFFVGSGGGGGGGYAIIPSIKIELAYLVGLLNSKVLDTYLKAVTTRFHSGWYAYSRLYLAQIPIKLPETAQERKLADQIVERVEGIIDAKNQLQKGAAGDRAVERLEREIEGHQQRIDELVCRLYGVDEIPDGEGLKADAAKAPGQHGME